MIHVVSGLPRSGTTGLMQAVAASTNLEVGYCKDREALNKRLSDEAYDLNPGNLLEIAFQDYDHDKFPLEYREYLDGPWLDGRGMLMKIFGNGLPTMLAYQYRVVYVKREFEAWKASQISAFQNGELNLRDARIKTAEDLDLRHERTIGIMRIRQDTKIVVFDYDELVEDPDKHAEMLIDRGWPIEKERFSPVIDKRRRRHHTV